MGGTPFGGTASPRPRCIATNNPDLLSCLLPIASCLLPFAFCLLPIAYCLLPLAFPKRDYVHNSNKNAIAS
ncbi:MAG: hypothetical protein F6K56_24585 [Moorea sp. SIO3G5]|nr:hypothetical protein [Moorena sp. SIO3G5]